MLTPFLLLLALSTPIAADAHFSCGPFLLQPGPREMMIVVDHEVPIPARLRYWTAAEDSEVVVQHEEAERHHVFSLEQLVPDTVYSYEITSGALNTGTHSFRTLPVRPESYRVLAVGDVRTNPADWAKVSGRMFEHEPDALFAIGTGDYPSDGRQYAQWVDQFFTPARRFLGHMPLWPAIGNHEATRRHDDVTRIEQSHYFSLFELPENERWYRVEYHLMTLLVLDSNSSLAPDQPQYKWLRSQLRSARNRFTLVALHHAPHSSGPHGHQHWDGTPGEWPIDQGRRFLVPLFEMYDVDIVLCGHDHLYERSEKDGVVYIVTGGGGAPPYKVDSVSNPYQQAAVSIHHYTALDISPAGIELTAIDKDGNVIDATVVPTTERHLARRTHALMSALERATRIGHLDPKTHVSEITFTNTLDHPLTVHIASAEGGHPVEPLHETLAVGERRKLALRVVDVGGQLDAEPWRAAVVLDLLIRYEGRDQALDLDVERPRKGTVYNPLYPTQRVEAVVADGALSEWTEVPAMTADERTPIVKNPESFVGPDDFGAQVKFAWSEGWLHLSADITDDRVVDDVETSIDENDSLRVLFDVRSGPSRGLAVYSFSASGRTDGEGLRHTTRKRDGGWILEASFPLEALGLRAPDGRAVKLSCDILFVDRDLEGEMALPSYHRFWTKSRSRSDKSTFGVLVLDD